jgi:choline dehydrogenase-like flavoprotein
MVAGSKRMLRILETPTFKSKNLTIVVDRHFCKSFRPFSDEYLECSLRHLSTTVYHHAGTCKMGPASDPLAVVDAQLAVRGVKNLRVIDASVMPNVVSGNTHAPVVMIGEKGADMVVAKWKSSAAEETAASKDEL